ncbi:uncharacterized protein V1510DRAFT_421291 [Dipodascopsis tothii]|uniref:uncharacterized protein n=1 Tax=Dipodascopsis tothii TaxID=44089 RepID=UPI0034CF661A
MLRTTRLTPRLCVQGLGRSAVRPQVLRNLSARKPAGSRLMASQVGVDPNDAFLQGNAANYIDEMYDAWRKDPTSVHISWQVGQRHGRNWVRGSSGLGPGSGPAGWVCGHRPGRRVRRDGPGPALPD